MVPGKRCPVTGLGVASACAFILKRFQLSASSGRLCSAVYTTVAPQKHCAVAGLGVASACAFILKRFQLAPGADSRQGGPAFNATIYEVALVVMSAYLAYLVSETLALSGIVTLFFTGICHAHYSYYSVTKEAAITLKRLFEFAAFLSEMFVFAYLGLQVSHTSSSSFVSFTCRFVLCDLVV